MKRFFKNGRMSPLFGGISFVVVMLLCTGEASAQIRAVHHPVDVKSAIAGKTFKSKQEAMNALSQQAQFYRQNYAAQQGSENEALYALRINYFSGVATEIDKGTDVFNSLSKVLDETLLPEGLSYGVVTDKTLQAIYEEAVTLVTL